MKKFKLVLYFLLVCVLIFTGCNKGKSYYFRLSENSITLEVGESIDVSTLSFNTNISTLEHMYIDNISNENFVIVEDLTLTGKASGETTIFVNVKYNNKIYSSKLDVIVIEKDENEISKDNEISFSVNTITTEDNLKSIYIISMYKNGNYFYDFNVELIDYEANYLYYYAKISYYYEISYAKDMTFKIKVTEIDNVKNYITINLPLEK